MSTDLQDDDDTEENYINLKKTSNKQKNEKEGNESMENNYFYKRNRYKRE